MRIKIEGHIYKVNDIWIHGYLQQIRVEGGQAFYLAKDSESAGEAAREYWEDVANEDPEELVALVGAAQIVSWAFGVGQNLSDWIDTQEQYPADQWSGWQEELTVNVCGRLLEEELGFIPTVAYRHN